MNARLLIGAALRESRGSRARLIFFGACLVIGVAAVVGVAALVGTIQSGIRSQSRELLGADAVVDSRRALPGDDELLLDRLSPSENARAERLDVRELSTMAVSKTNGQSRLVEVKAVGPGFPFYGKVGLQPALALDTLGAERVAVAPELAETLGARVGDTVSIGAAEFEIAALVVDEPGRLDAAFTFGPRVFMGLDGLERADLGSFGSRVRYRALIRVPDGVSTAALRRWKSALAERPEAIYWSTETHDDAQPALRRGIRNVERYLALAALLSLLLGGTGVAQIVRAWIGARTQNIAVLRCLGFRPREVLLLYAGNVVLFAALASALGALIGSLLPLWLATALAGVLPTGLVLAWEPASMVRGIILGIGIALVFSIPPLTAIWRVPPARVLRAEAEPLPVQLGVVCGAVAILILGVFGAAWLQSGELVHASVFTGGVAVLTGVLALAAWGLTKLAGVLPRERMSPYLMNGVAALARPGAGTIGAVVALGLGVLVIAAMGLIETRLTARLQNALPHDAPSAFLLDVQPDQWESVERILLDNGATSIRGVPVVTARLAKIDDRDVRELELERREQRRSEADGPSERRPRGWTLTREQRLTWASELTSDNELIEGSLWSDPGALEVSLEESYAEGLAAKLGTRLTFDVQGVEVELLVTSIRTVEWESFGINFFLLAEPGALDAAPHFMLATARLDPTRENALQNALAAEFPNISMIRVRAVIEKVVAVLQRLATGVRVLSSFTILTGLVILAGVASAAAVHRGREVALLKTLGVTRAGIVLLFATEFALIGLVAGTIGAVAAMLLAWQFLSRLAQMSAELSPWTIPLAAGATALIAVLCGLAASARALTARPIEALRQ